jgi:hypothetical protein
MHKDWYLKLLSRLVQRDDAHLYRCRGLQAAIPHSRLNAQACLDRLAAQGVGLGEIASHLGLDSADDLLDAVEALPDDGWSIRYHAVDTDSAFAGQHAGTLAAFLEGRPVGDEGIGGPFEPDWHNAIAALCSAWGTDGLDPIQVASRLGLTFPELVRRINALPGAFDPHGGTERG